LKTGSHLDQRSQCVAGCADVDGTVTHSWRRRRVRQSRWHDPSVIILPRVTSLSLPAREYDDKSRHTGRHPVIRAQNTLAGIARCRGGSPSHCHCERSRMHTGGHRPGTALARPPERCSWLYTASHALNGFAARWICSVCLRVESPRRDFSLPEDGIFWSHENLRFSQAARVG